MTTIDDHDDAEAIAETVEDEGIVDTEAAGARPRQPTMTPPTSDRADESADDEKKDS